MKKINFNYWLELLLKVIGLIVIGALGWLAFLIVVFMWIFTGTREVPKPTLPISENISLWVNENYADNFPKELLGNVVAMNSDGFTDTITIGLYALEETASKSLQTTLDNRFELEKIGMDINQYVEDAICFGKTDHNSWLINEAKIDEYFTFCSQINNSEKKVYELIIRKNDYEFSFIKITHYLNSNFFTVSHGSS